MRFRNVVEGHHHKGEEQHRRDCSDPIPVSRQNAVLICRAGPTHQFQRAEIGGKETEPRDPGSHFSSGHEKIFARIRPLLQVEADSKHQSEIENNDDQINRG